MDTTKKYTTLKDFYPFYLKEHSNMTSRVLHFIGTGLVFVLLIAALLIQRWWLLALIPFYRLWLCVGRAFLLEKNNRPHFNIRVTASLLILNCSLNCLPASGSSIPAMKEIKIDP